MTYDLSAYIPEPNEACLAELASIGVPPDLPSLVAWDALRAARSVPAYDFPMWPGMELWHAANLRLFRFASEAEGWGRQAFKGNYYIANQELGVALLALRGENGVGDARASPRTVRPRSNAWDVDGAVQFNLAGLSTTEQCPLMWDGLRVFVLLFEARLETLSASLEISRPAGLKNGELSSFQSRILLPKVDFRPAAERR